MNRNSLQRLALMSVLTALGVVLAALIHFPLFPAVPFLEYDPADVPVLLCTFLFGPGWGIGITFAVSLFQGLTVSASGGWYGIVMHILATSAYAAVAGIFYHRHRTLKGAVGALLLGMLAMVLVMIPANLLITPLFTGQSVESVLGWILLFNALKAGLNGLVTFFIYKPLKRIFKL